MPGNKSSHNSSVTKFCVLRVLMFALSVIPLSSSAYGQLISPGRLAGAHSDLEGITNCTSCHELGQRSAANNLCLDCHTPLKSRIEALEGFHSTVVEENCADCHKEHFGVDFVLVRLDTLQFDHNDTGFELRGSHETASCRGCHQPDNILATDVRSFKGEHGALEKTFLGLDASCIGCHVDESPHENQFAEQECNTCHEEEQWDEAPVFNHEEARFALIGEHRDVTCDGCHKEVSLQGGPTFVQYTDLQFNQCTACHEDAHDGSFGTDCASCHSPEGWGNLSQDLANSDFDHESTGFSLIGAHAKTNCASCHAKPARRDREIFVTFIGSTARNSFPKLLSDNCQSCHVDYHDGELIDVPNGGALCENCHGQHAWFPASYDIERHNREASFELTGAHLATPCIGCHVGSANVLSFDIEETECRDCHMDDNPHGDQFADPNSANTNKVTKCATCHIPDAWQQASAGFDHDQTDFPLTGRHNETTCVSCHKEETLPTGETQQVFSGLETNCASCHVEDDPHQGQFIGITCDTCHNTDAFTVSEFDHETTRFPLTGSHIDVSCESCHVTESAPDESQFIRYTPIKRQCENCHGEE